MSVIFIGSERLTQFDTLQPRSGLVHMQIDYPPPVRRYEGLRTTLISPRPPRIELCQALRRLRLVFLPTESLTSPLLTDVLVVVYAR